MSLPHHDPQPEIRLKSVLKNLLSDEELSDLKLEGNDGVIVSANRVILAARSPVFRRMLFGDFEEARKTMVPVGYTGEVLQSIVEYCYTDTAGILNKEDSVAPETIVSLADAANYFGLTTLRLKSQDRARSLMEQKPYLACIFLDESRSCVGAGVKEHALDVIRAEPCAALLEGNGVSSVDPSVLELILKDKNIQADEHTMFLALKLWVEAGKDCPEGPVTERSTTGRSESRHDIATKLIAHIRLDQIAPSVLKSVIVPSGLVPAEQLTAAYETQALEAESRDGISYNKLRFTRPVWRCSNSDVFTGSTQCHTIEMLDCAVMRAGLHTWRLQVKSEGEDLNVCPTVCLGVASTAHQVDTDTWLGHKRGAWGYVSKGRAFHNLKHFGTSLPEFGVGSVVTFTLDLTRPGNGTLCAAIDGGDEFLLFRNMHSAFDETQVFGLLPAVSMRGAVSVRFLGFQSTHLEGDST